MRDALEGGFFNEGEACTAASRVVVQRGAHDTFIERLAAGVRALKVGRRSDPATHLGPVVTQAQQQKVVAHIDLGREEGATVTAQAALPDDPALAGGYYVAPTLFRGVTRDMCIAQEEIFGPVVTVTVFDTEEEAISIANEPEYGLLAAVYSDDLSRAMRVARKIDAGVVLINNYFRGMMGTPFGGTKHSGFGREHVIETLREFSYPKMLRFPSGLGDTPSWRAVRDVYGDASGSVGSTEYAATRPALSPPDAR